VVEKAMPDMTGRPEAGIGPARLLQLGKERTDAMLHIHEELLEAYHDASKAWLNRVQSEVEFWSQLAEKLAASHSVPEGMQAYTGSISQRLQMAADDGRRLLEEGQKISAAITRSLSTAGKNN